MSDSSEWDSGWKAFTDSERSETVFNDAYDSARKYVASTEHEVHSDPVVIVCTVIDYFLGEEWPTPDASRTREWNDAHFSAMKDCFVSGWMKGMESAHAEHHDHEHADEGHDEQDEEIYTPTPPTQDGRMSMFG